MNQGRRISCQENFKTVKKLPCTTALGVCARTSLAVSKKYENGLYHVRYLAGNKRPRNDLVFACKVHELHASDNDFYQTAMAQLAATYNDMLRSFASDRYHYRHSDIQLTWLSYAVERLRDNAFTRTFPISETVWRISRVY